MARPLKVCVCGGGNGAHVMAALAASIPDTEVRVLTLFNDEATRWGKELENGGMEVKYVNKDGSSSQVKSTPETVSKDPSAVVPESDLLIMVVPAFAHELYFQAVSPHIDKKCVIIGLPGKPGFEFQCFSHLGDKAEQITIMSFEALPWSCKVLEYGKTVEVYSTFKNLSGFILRGKAIPRKPPLMSLQTLLGFEPRLTQTKHYLEVLFTSFCFLNPAVIYGRWKYWDGEPLEEEPPLYSDISQETTDLLIACSKEVTDVAHAITAKYPSVDLTEIPDIFNWYLTFYGNKVQDKTNLIDAICSNEFHKREVHQMTKYKRKYKPDFKNSLLSEDLPMGVAVIKGVAEILEVETPMMDILLDWGQDRIEKQYIVNGKLTGEDVKSTRCPQTYGLTTIEDIIKGRKTST